MSNSEVGICNIALGWLGEDSITSLDDTTVVAQLCKENYALKRDAVLEARYWRFADLRKVSETNLRPGDRPDEEGFPEWGDKYIHPIPQGYAQVFRVYTDTIGTELPQENWERIGNYIVTDENLVYMAGTRIVTDPNQFSALFIDAVAARLAADLAIPVTHSRSLQADMWSLYNDKISEAAVRDGQQGRSESLNATRLTRARSR